MGLGPTPVSLAGLAGVITDTQHGARTGPNDSHELADISGTVSVAQQGGQRTEAKETAGAAAQESVTWTTAFSATPIVTTSLVIGVDASAATVVSRSTTGATVRNATADAGRVKLVSAQVAT